jgi:hypothetical protein
VHPSPSSSTAPASPTALPHCHIGAAVPLHRRIDGSSSLLWHRFSAYVPHRVLRRLTPLVMHLLRCKRKQLQPLRMQSGD